MRFNKYPKLQLAVNNNYSRSSCLPAILIILQATFNYCPFVVVLVFLVCVNKPFILNMCVNRQPFKCSSKVGGENSTLTTTPPLFQDKLSPAIYETCMLQTSKKLICFAFNLL